MIDRVEPHPFEVPVEATEGPLRKDSVALCSQLRTVSMEHRIAENLRPIPDDRIQQVDRVLGFSPGLNGPG